MIDMHSHILFGVDDGAKSIKESLVLIKEEVEKGVRHIILTPHYKRGVEFNKDKINLNYNMLKELIKSESINAELYLGNEIYLNTNYYEILNKGDFYTLAGSRYILVEFGLMDSVKNIPEMCYEARLKGYIPIIAHVERYEQLYEDKQILKDILNEEALLQVNATALINKESKGTIKFAKYLLKNRLISFAASDVHNMDSRAFYLDEAYNSVKKSCGAEYADKIFMINQHKIITDEYIQCPKITFNRDGIIKKLFNIRNLNRMKGDNK